jgi:UDP-glucose 4-epimerase
VTGEDFEVRFVDRRDGDPAAAVASNARARTALQWEPHRSDLENIVIDAWAAHQLP